MRKLLCPCFACELPEFRRTWCACFFGSILWAGALSAQDLPAQASLNYAPVPSDTLLTISKRVDEVQLVFTVTDKKGRFVDELTMEDFRLLDNDLPPERVIKFQQRSDLPLQVVLLVDVSTSVQARFAFEQKAAATFLKNILRPAVDSAAVISFGSRVRQVQSMTRSLEELQAAVQRLRIDGDTALYDALLLGSANYSSKVGSDGARKVMIILTDGADTWSRAGENEALAAVAESGAMVVVIDASSSPPFNENGQYFLKRLTTVSGGVILRAADNDELKAALRRVEKGLRTQYALSYKPAGFQTDGSYRSIRVTLQQPKWIAHCRAGYYAKPR